jgi:hypothetical protein
MSILLCAGKKEISFASTFFFFSEEYNQFVPFFFRRLHGRELLYKEGARKKALFYGQ